MPDFAQTGLICTLQRLNETHLPAIERELDRLGKSRTIALILPCHGRDLLDPALRHIVEELKDARFLHRIVVSLNGIDAPGWSSAHELFRPLGQRVRLLWTDGPKLGPLLARRAAGGKGLNVWCGVGLLHLEGGTEIIALQDADVSSFRRQDLARLCYACAHPQLSNRFAKMYYSRATGRLYGRVSRLFLTPLLNALVRAVGRQPVLDYLLSFRYPLAGEAALTCELAAQLPFGAGWNFDLALLCAVFRSTDRRRICQVEGAAEYDHKHHSLENGAGLLAMSRCVVQTLFAELAVEGAVDEPALRAAVTEAYRVEALMARRRFAALAQINQLQHCIQSEQELCAAFAPLISEAPGQCAAMLPAWTCLEKTDADWCAAFHRAANEGGELTPHTRAGQKPAMR